MKPINAIAKIKLYLDEHMPRPLAKALRQREIEVIMAIDVNMISKDDDTEHLPFAAEQGAAIFTRDRPFAGRTSQRTDHAGMVCWTGTDDDLGGRVRALTEFAQKHTAEDVVGKVFWVK